MISGEIIKAPCASLLIRDATFREPRRIKHNSNQNHGATPEQDPSNDLPQRACGHTSARGLREFDAVASHPRMTTGSCEPGWELIYFHITIVISI